MIVIGAIPLAAALAVLVWSLVRPKRPRRRWIPWLAICFLAALGACLLLEGVGRLLYLSGDSRAAAARIFRTVAFLPAALFVLGYQMSAKHRNQMSLLVAGMVVALMLLQVVLTVVGQLSPGTSRVLYAAEIIGMWYACGMPKPLPFIWSGTEETVRDHRRRRRRQRPDEDSADGGKA